MIPQADMDLLKEEVKHQIDNADPATVRMIHAMLEAKEGEDWWDELPEGTREEIDAAIASIGNGEGIPHEEVMKTIDARISLS